MATLPTDVILEIAECCAASLEFRTLVNIALASHEVHDALKKRLGQQVLVWDGNYVDLPGYDTDNERLVPSERWKEVKFLVLPRGSQDLYHGGRITLKRLLPKLRVIMALHIRKGVADRWHIHVCDATPLSQSLDKSALIMENILHHRFKLGQGETYDSGLALADLSRKTWTPPGLLPLYFSRNNDVELYTDTQVLLQLGGLLVWMGDEERRVTIEAIMFNDAGSASWYFEQVKSAIRKDPRCVYLEFELNTIESDDENPLLTLALFEFYASQHIALASSRILLKIGYGGTDYHHHIIYHPAGPNLELLLFHRLIELQGRGAPVITLTTVQSILRQLHSHDSPAINDILA